MPQAAAETLGRPWRHFKILLSGVTGSYYEYVSDAPGRRLRLRGSHVLESRVLGSQEVCRAVSHC